MYQFGKRLKEIRERMGLSQKTLGMMLGLSDKAISSYESGRTVPPLETLQKIAEELHIPLSQLLLADDQTFSISNKLIDIEKKLNDIINEIQEIKQDLAQEENLPPTQPNTTV